jgi:DNA-binding NarL/FixJ family response regulator
MSPVPIRVVIADDDIWLLRDFRELLELEPDIEVVGVALDGAAAVDLCAGLLPDVVVMDVRMPVMNGIDATAALRQGRPDTCRVLVVTTFDLDDYVLGAVRAGASGFLLKDQAVEQLAAGIRTIARGDAIVAPRATARLLAELIEPTSPAPTGRSTLTDRELDIVRLIARGMTNEDIATEAFISRATVKTHVSSILSKLALTSRVQIVMWAYENGWADAAPDGMNLDFPSDRGG